MKNFLVLVPLILVAMALNQTEDQGSAMTTLTEINDLASTDHLRSEADAAKYVAALWSHFKLGSKIRVNVTPAITTPSQRETEYAAAVERYSQTHSETALVQSANRFLSQLLRP